MAARDYKFYPAAISGHVYLAKKIKSKNLMSQDRRIVTDEEAIGIFEAYLRRYCKDNNTDTVNITDAEGKLLFSATLNDRKED